MKKKYLKLIGNILSLAAIVFVIVKLVNLKPQIDFEINRSRLIAAGFIGIIISVIANILLGLIWSSTIYTFSDKSSRGIIKKGCCTYLKANLSKYIPGNIFQYVERNLFLSESGLSQILIAVSSAFEILGLLLAGVILSVILNRSGIYEIINSSFTGFSTALIIGIIAVIVTGIVLFIVFLKKNAKFREGIKRAVKPDALLKFAVNIILYALVLMLIGTILVISYYGLTGIMPDSRTIFMLLGAYIVSWIAGFIIIGAPGGMGIRELVLTLVITDKALLSIILPAAVIQRIITVIGDVISYLITFAFKSGKAKEK